MSIAGIHWRLLVRYTSVKSPPLALSCQPTQSVVVEMRGEGGYLDRIMECAVQPARAEPVVQPSGGGEHKRKEKREKE